MKKILVSDFDNTLLFDHHFKDEDIQAIHSFQKDGNLFVVCTGRSYEGIRVPSEGYIDYDYYILATGSYILDREANVVFQSPLRQEDITHFEEKYRNRYLMAYNTGNQYYAEDIYYQKTFGAADIKTMTGSLMSLAILCENTQQAQLEEEIIEKEFPNLKGFVNKIFIDVVNKECSKGSALSYLKQRYPDSKIYGIGDSYNDLSLLEASDISFTFSSSPEDIQNRVNHVVNSVAQAIEIIRKD